MSDERAQVRRQVLAELIELAKSHADGHYDLLQQAEQYGREDMRIRAEHCVNAWREVERVLRFDARQYERDPRSAISGGLDLPHEASVSAAPAESPGQAAAEPE